MTDPNNFSTAHRLPANDERQELFAKQRAERGFDSTELWNLDCTIAKFILPRLKAFALPSCPITPHGLTDEEWQSILAEMITFFEIVAGYWTEPATDEDNDERGNRGLELFCRYFHSLWY